MIASVLICVSAWHRSFNLRRGWFKPATQRCLGRLTDCWFGPLKHWTYCNILEIIRMNPCTGIPSWASGHCLYVGVRSNSSIWPWRQKCWNMLEQLGTYGNIWCGKRSCKQKTLRHVPKHAGMQTKPTAWQGTLGWILYALPCDRAWFLGDNFEAHIVVSLSSAATPWFAHAKLGILQTWFQTSQWKARLENELGNKMML